MTVEINLNDIIKVKLTEFGEDIYYHRYDDVNTIVGTEICKPSYPMKDENGYTKFQLWDFMKLYGSYMTMGSPNVIESNKLIYLIWKEGDV